MGGISPALTVGNVSEAVAFYCDTLGFTAGIVFPDIDNPEYADVAKDGMTIMFIKEFGVSGKKDAKPGVGVTLYMQIDGDIDEYYREVTQKGVTVLTGIADEPWGSRDFTIVDNTGYLLTFTQISKSAKICMSCGMPMIKEEDFGGSDPNNLYCVYCCHSNGTLKSREDVLEGIAQLMMMNRKLGRPEAETAAVEHMSKMPAWKDRI